MSDHNPIDKGKVNEVVFDLLDHLDEWYGPDAEIEHVLVVVRVTDAGGVRCTDVVPSPGTPKEEALDMLEGSTVPTAGRWLRRADPGAARLVAEGVRGTSPDGGQQALAARQGGLIPAGRMVARQGLRVAEEAAERTDKGLRVRECPHEAELRTAVFGALKTADYDAQTVDEISKRIDGLSGDQPKQVREFEKNHKNRGILVA